MLPEEITQGVAAAGFGEDQNAIVRVHDKIAAGNADVVAAQHGGDQRTAGQAEVFEGLADDGRGSGELEFHHFRIFVAQAGNGEHRAAAQVAQDGAHRQQPRVNAEVEVHRFQDFEVMRLAGDDDGVTAAAQFTEEERADEIIFIVRTNADKNIGAVDARAQQEAFVEGGAVHDLHPVFIEGDGGGFRFGKVCSINTTRRRRFDRRRDNLMPATSAPKISALRMGRTSGSKAREIFAQLLAEIM